MCMYMYMIRRHQHTLCTEYCLRLRQCYSIIELQWTDYSTHSRVTPMAVFLCFRLSNPQRTTAG